MAGGRLTGTVLAAEELHQGWGGLCLASALLLEAFGQNDPVGLIQMALYATLGALDPFSLLPKLVCGMGIVGFIVGLIDTAAVNEGCENAFVGSFVDREAVFAAFQVAGGLLVCMFISRNNASLVVFFPKALLAGRSGSAASCSRSSQASWRRCSVISVVRP